MIDLRLRMVQTRPVLGDVERNIDRMLDFIDSDADVICFPEMNLTGYSSEISWKHGIGTDHPGITRIRDAAKDNGTTIVFGFPEVSKNERYITQAIASPDGSIELYRKTHLGRFERSHFTQGDDFLCMDIGCARLGLNLCWESHIPDISTCLRARGAELILMPHASFKDPARRIELWKRYLPARAYDNRVFVAACDMLGDGNGGGILIIDPDGRVIVESASGEECAIDCILHASMSKRPSPEDMETMSGTDFFAGRRPELYRFD